ncbi:hypothetical protein EWM64_g1814 [Hericium alpestre]|uniref:Uncharacterized protein n=1 Tax=Hericium alpestre TaxID=135208 RepID=A0A4Z0A7C7_9AGAM|nr:hypothetical protein EWM64_g1814 [Hericium alpestre]
MAATLSSASHFHAPQSRHFLGHPSSFGHDGFSSSHNHHYGPTDAHNGRHYQQPQHGFEVFAHHHASSHSPAATTVSWRAHAPASPAKEPGLQVPAPKSRGANTSPARYTHTRSSSSLDATSSWRVRSSPDSSVPASPAKKATQVASAVPILSIDPPKPASLVYSIGDLLRLASSPRVGINLDAQIRLEEHVAHEVWRRGRSGHTGAAPRPPRKSGDNKRRSPRNSSVTDSDSN